MRLPRMTARRWLIALAVLASGLGGFCGLWWSAYRAAMLAEARYNSEMQGLHATAERRLRAEIAGLRPGSNDLLHERKSTDRLFEMLRLSQVAGNSREVEAWRQAPHSPERRAVALKWAEVAADQAAYMVALHERWGEDYKRFRMPHHISDREVKPFEMPADWTEEDLRYGAGRPNQ